MDYTMGVSMATLMICMSGMHGANQRGSGTSDPCHPRSHQSILYPSGCGVSLESYAIHLVIPSLPHNV